MLSPWVEREGWKRGIKYGLDGYIHDIILTDWEKNGCPIQKKTCTGK